MSRLAQKHSLAETLERIQAVFAELRQTEALEAQVHEMVVMKRHRLDALMTDYLQHAVLSEDIPQPVVAAAPASLPQPLPAAAPMPTPAPLPPPAPVEDMPLSPHGLYGAPRDLLKGQPTPSAQHVLDSLNRLMTGIKDISPKSANAA